jgi:hypothetical protein
LVPPTATLSSARRLNLPDPPDRGIAVDHAGVRTGLPRAVTEVGRILPQLLRDERLVVGEQVFDARDRHDRLRDERMDDEEWKIPIQATLSTVGAGD